MKQGIIGGHFSISNGFDSMLEIAENNNASAVQFFVSNNRSWQINYFTPERIASFKNSANKSKIKYFVVHATYLINLASINEEIIEKSKISLIQQLQLCDELNIPFLVLHPGSFTTGDRNHGIMRVAQSLNEIFGSQKFHCKILIENMAGQGSTVGVSFEELAEIRKNVENKTQLGFCLDTCHLFASGNNFLSKENLDSLLNNFNNICGLENLFVVHLNDSEHSFDSRKDRHANIGSGKIGLINLKQFFHHELLNEKIFILETPWENNLIPRYKEEIKSLR